MKWSALASLLVVAGFCPRWAEALNPDADEIRVTHIRFDHKGTDNEKGDGLLIRQSFRDKLKHDGNGPGWGEWIRPGSQDEDGGLMGRNEPALWVAKDTVTMSVRFESTHPYSRFIYAKPVNGQLPTTKEVEVWFRTKDDIAPEPTFGTTGFEFESSGSTDTVIPKYTFWREWVVFGFTQPVTDKISRLEDIWEWNIQTIDANGHTQWEKFDSSPKPWQQSAIPGDKPPPVHVVYVVLDVPKLPWYLAGVEQHRPWVSALDFTIVRAGTRGLDKLEDTAKKLTTYVHSSYYYNTVDTEAAYCTHPEGGPEKFDFTNFMRRAKKLGHVNCADCANSVATMLNLLGAGSDVYYIEPFGYIKTDYLVGGILANNPAPVQTTNPLLVDESWVEKARGKFDLHEWVEFEERVYDATIGPHLGADSRPDYFRKAQDDPPAAPIGSKGDPANAEAMGWTNFRLE